MSVQFKKRTRTTPSAAKRVSTAVVDDDENAEVSGTTVQDLLTLRQLSKNPTGIELSRLNAGEKKKSKQQKSSPTTTDAVAAPRTLISAHQFQGETGTVDVDKHMMEYIEAQMRARTGEASTDAVSTGSRDREEELYAVAEQFKALERSLQPQRSQEEREGDVTLSAAMLSSIPEVDLGISSRLSNIQSTEQARQRQQTAKDSDPEEGTHNSRFSNTKRRQTATDQLVLERFKQRQKR